MSTATQTTVKTPELANASQYPKFYYARHMVPGLCGYEDETVLIDVDTMKRAAPTFNGRPVYVLHDERPIAERIKNIDDADGYVTETFYNELDGWLWSKIMMKTDHGNQHIGKGWHCSNAYIPIRSAAGGEKNNVPYDREYTEIEFTHLAIVDNPRYEQACVMTPDAFKIYQESNREQLNELKNSKTTKEGTVMFFKRTKEAVSEIDADTLVEIKNDKGEVIEIPVSEMVNAVQAARAADEKAKKEKSNASAKIKVGDTEMTVEELVNSFQKLNAKKGKKNSDDADADEKDNGEDEDAEMENQSDEEKDNEDDEDEAKNAKSNHFKELSNANKKVHVQRAPRIDTTQNKMQRGLSKYGAATKH